MEHSFESVDRFIIGTVGLPGEREFYLQLANQERISSFAMEKGQAIALVERLQELLRELRRRDSSRYQAIFRSVEVDDGPLSTPVESEFALGEMSLTWMDESERILFEANSLQEEEEGLLKVLFSLGQAMEFIRRSERVISAGRAPCPFCGLPLNLDGHLCPRANGYRR